MKCCQRYWRYGKVITNIMVTIGSFRHQHRCQNHYNSHTRHCLSCSGALRWIRRIRPFAWGLLWVSACLVGLGQAGGLSIVGLVLGTLAALVVRQSNRWERGLMAGDGIAPRNQP